MEAKNGWGWGGGTPRRETGWGNGGEGREGATRWKRRGS